MHKPERTKMVREHDHKSLELFYEFQWQSLVQAVELLQKSITYYFAILAALIGYLFTAKLSQLDQQLISRVIFVVSGLFIVIAVSFSYGVLRGISDMKQTMAQYNPSIFYRIGLNEYFRRGRTVGVVVITASLLILVTICVALVLKFFA